MAEFFGTTVSDIFNTMPKRFKPEAAKGVDVVIGYECGGEGGGKWKLTVKDQTAKVETVEGDLGTCTATIVATDAETFIGVTLQKIGAIDALSQGKMRVVGDTRMLMTLLPQIFVQYTVPETKADVTARGILSAIGDRFRPDKAAGVTLKYGYDLTGEGGGRFTITIADGKCTLKEGLDSDLAVKMTMEAATYVGMMTGTIDGTAAFTSGKVKIDGDMMAAAATGKYFNKYVDPNAQEAEELLSLKMVTSIGQRFATGPVMGKWFAGLREMKLLASVCPLCKRTLILPQEICQFCHVRTTGYVELGPEGSVSNFDLVYFASPDPLTGEVRDTPYACAWIMLDRATPEEAFCFEIKKEDLPKLQIGSRVRPVWAEKPTGSFRDILHFEIID